LAGAPSVSSNRGGIAEGTIRLAANKSKLPEYLLNISGGGEHVAVLFRALAFFGKLTRKTVDQANELKDADTARTS
jgi:starvation-inducible DNA-binding protein